MGQIKNISTGKALTQCWSILFLIKGFGNVYPLNVEEGRDLEIKILFKHLSDFLFAVLECKLTENIFLANDAFILIRKSRSIEVMSCK